MPGITASPGRGCARGPGSARGPGGVRGRGLAWGPRCPEHLLHPLARVDEQAGGPPERPVTSRLGFPEERFQGCAGRLLGGGHVHIQKDPASPQHHAALQRRMLCSNGLELYKEGARAGTPGDVLMSAPE